MAAMPAYRYDHAQAQPQRVPESHPAPRIQVVPGTRSTQNPSLSGNVLLFLNVLVALIAVFLIVGFVRIGISAASYDVAAQASAVREDISEARAVQENLAVQKSASANPIVLREQAAGQLGMTAPAALETITLPADVVAYDAAGNISLTDSVARLAALS